MAGSLEIGASHGSRDGREEVRQVAVRGDRFDGGLFILECFVLSAVPDLGWY